MGRRAARHRLGAAGHLHRRHRAGRADDDLPAARSRSGPATGGRPTSPPPPHAGPADRRARAGQHRLGQGQPGGVRRQRGRPGPALRPHQGVHAARPAAVDRGERHLRRRALPVADSTVAHASGRARATAGTRGSTSAAPPRPPSGSPRPRRTSSCSGASRSTASAERIERLDTLSEELGREHAPLEFGLRITTLVRDTTEQAWADAEAKVAKMAEGRGHPRDRAPAGAVGQQRLLDLAARGEVLDDNLYTAPGRYGGGGAGTTWLVGSAEDVAEVAAQVPGPGHHPLRPLRHALPARRSSARATSCCRCCARSARPCPVRGSVAFLEADGLAELVDRLAQLVGVARVVSSSGPRGPRR